MAQQLLEYRVVVDTGTGQVSIDGLTKGFVSANAAAKALKDTTKGLETNLGQGASKMGLAGAAITELGRTISDSNYGMTAMANNLQQLSTLFVTLVSTTEGGLIPALKLMWKALMGPLGVILVFQTIFKFMEQTAMEAKRVASSANDMVKALDAQLAVQKELYDRAIERGDAVDEILEKERELAQLKLTELQIQLLELENQRALAAADSKRVTFLEMMLGKRAEVTKEELEGIAALDAAISETELKLLKLDEFIKGGGSKGGKKDDKKDKKDKKESDTRIERIKAEIEQEELLASVYEKTSENQSLGYAERQKANLSYGESLDIIYNKTAELNDLLIEEANLTGDSNKIKAAQIEKENALFEVNEKRSNQVSKIAELTQGEIDLQKSSLKSREEYTFALEELAILQIENEVERARALKELHDREALSEKQRLLDSINNTQEGTEARQKATDAYLTWYIERLRQAGEDEAAIAEAVAKIRKKTTEDNDASYKESLGILQQSLDAVGMALQGFSKMAEKDSKRQKKLAAAAAIIDTLSAIVGALRAAQKSPGAAIPGYAIAQAIATGIFGFAQVKKILATDPTGGNNGDTTRPAPSPTFNVVGSSGSSQLREAVEKGMEKPVKAYVTQKDINSSAELDRNTRKSATIV